MAKLLTYGTLIEQGREITHELPGYMMFEVVGKSFNFPVITPYPYDDTLPSVKGCISHVDEADFEKLDIYEGVSRGLYVRVKAIAYPLNQGYIKAPEEVWVYVGGPALVHKPIPSGIWSERDNVLLC